MTHLNATWEKPVVKTKMPLLHDTVNNKIKVKRSACVLYVYSYINNTKRTFYANIFNFRAVAMFSLAVHPCSYIYYVAAVCPIEGCITPNTVSTDFGGIFFPDVWRFVQVFSDF